MDTLDKIEVVAGDITSHPSDLAVLKFAEEFRGADEAAARVVGFGEYLPRGAHRIVPGAGSAATEVAFLGVGPLYEFRYDAIMDFGMRTLAVAAERPGIRVLTTTIHGPGFGLDETESFLSNVRGLMSAPEDETLERIIFVERSEERVERLQSLLTSFVGFYRTEMEKPPVIPDDIDDLLPPLPYAPGPPGPNHAPQETDPFAPGPAGSDFSDTFIGAPPESSPFDDLTGDYTPAPAPIPDAWDQPEPGQVRPPAAAPVFAPAGYVSPDSKPKLFVAMPYADKYDDEYYIGFEEAAHPLGYLCESLKYETYTGDIVDEIERRIRAADGMIALINDLNPNVFLEIGYAMALEKPIIFVAREGLDVPFDIRNQRRITYSGIRQLRLEMERAIKGLSGI